MEDLRSKSQRHADSSLPGESSLQGTLLSGRASSTDTATGSERKRRRKVLSCYDCRRRKLQCDRTMPACGRCVKSGQADSCLYIDDAAELSTRLPDPTFSHANSELDRSTIRGQSVRQHQDVGVPPDAISRLESQDRRIKQLEATVAHSAQGPDAYAINQLKVSSLPLTPDSIAAMETKNVGAQVLDRETMLFRGGSFKSQFHGATHIGGLVAYSAELGTFTKETFEKFPALARVRHDMGALEERFAESRSGPKAFVSDENLKALLPSKSDADQSIQLYLDNFGGIYHIFHLPTFRQEYNAMFDDVTNARAHMVAIVLLLCAAAAGLSSSHDWIYMGNSSIEREVARRYIQACEAWLQSQSQKHVTVADFQIRFLLLLAKRANVIKSKRFWTDAGSFLRFCMASGLHRDPDYLRKPTTALDKELRRRMWTAITEFELQTCFERGMVSTPWPLQSDCRPPSNVSDDSFDLGADQIPLNRPLQQYTSASFLAISHETLILRHTLNTALNNIRYALSFEEAKRYTDEIVDHLDNLPEWVGTSSEASAAMLSLNLRQFLIAMHNKQLRQAKSTFDQNYCRMVLINTAEKMMATHRLLANEGLFGLEILREDAVRAAASVCHVASTLDPRVDSMISPMIQENADRIAAEAIDRVSDVIVRIGCEQRQLWITVASHGYLKATRDPENRLYYMQEAVDKVTRPYYKIMASQESTLSAVHSLSYPRHPATQGFIEYLPRPQSTAAQGDLSSANDPPLPNLEDIAAWTFDDFALDSADLEQLLSQPFAVPT